MHSLRTAIIYNIFYYSYIKTHISCLDILVPAMYWQFRGEAEVAHAYLTFCFLCSANS